ncbi:phospholipid scramblase 1-like [Drosophila hydei]|uniref:Phospholipid scramblase n=1 Tax=Drosophila hydei TaxID=7224 RepID=A0A6J2SQV6_DROHY|nr:phospholipid scramblase 1-like [Drosophila hydei]
MDMKEVPKALGEMASPSRKEREERKKREEKKRDKEKQDMDRNMEPDEWMDASRAASGIEVLSSLDKIYVSQKLMPFDVYTNKYFTFKIKNEQGKNVFAARERPSCLAYLLSRSHPFTIDLADSAGNMIMMLDHPFVFDIMPCITCCESYMNVYAPPGNYIGRMMKVISYKYSEYVIQDADGSDALYVDGPTVLGDIAKVNMTIWDLNDRLIGKITKEFPVLLSLFTQSSFFVATFPVGLSVKLKALILAGIFLVMIAGM